jgi:DNA-binding NarL/FixJ family response regulator
MTAADLTAEQRVLLERLCTGRGTLQIAYELGMAPSTLGHHVMRLKDRIGVRSLFQLGAWSERHGIRERAG